MQDAIKSWQVKCNQALPLVCAFCFLFVCLLNFKIHVFQESNVRFFFLIIISFLFYLWFGRNKQWNSSYLQNIYHLKLKDWCLWLVFALILLNVFVEPLLRRLVFMFFLISPLIIIAPVLVNAWSISNYYIKLLIVFLFITIASWILPGFYFPPFYGGIAGWTGLVNEKSPIRVVGLQLVNDSGQHIWFTNNIVDPNNFIFRQLNREMENGKQQTAILLNYYFKVYTQRYSLLEKGLSPTQRFIRFGFVEDDLQKNFNYSAFPPNKVQYIRMINYYYDPESLKLKSVDIEFNYDLQKHHFTKFG